MRPNILLMHSDQHRADCLGCSGHAVGYVGKGYVSQDSDPTSYGFDRYVPEHDYAGWRPSQGLSAPADA